MGNGVHRRARVGIKNAVPSVVLESEGLPVRLQCRAFDWAGYQILRGLPKIVVDEALVVGHDDYANAMEEVRGRVHEQRGPFGVWHASGMSGGYLGISRARDYLRAMVTRPPHVMDDMYKLRGRTDPEKLTVSVHIRGGDFSGGAGTPRPGEFNKVIPIEWYFSALRLVRNRFGSDAQFAVLPILPRIGISHSYPQEFQATEFPFRRLPLLSDILYMAESDLLICSISSLSMFSAFLSGNNYVRFGPHLGEAGGWLSIWGHEPQQVAGRTHLNRTGGSLENALGARGVGYSDGGDFLMLCGLGWTML